MHLLRSRDQTARQTGQKRDIVSLIEVAITIVAVAIFLWWFYLRPLSRVRRIAQVPRDWTITVRGASLVDKIVAYGKGTVDSRSAERGTKWLAVLVNLRTPGYFKSALQLSDIRVADEARAQYPALAIAPIVSRSEEGIVESVGPTFAFFEEADQISVPPASKSGWLSSRKPGEGIHADSGRERGYFFVKDGTLSVDPYANNVMLFLFRVPEALKTFGLSVARKPRGEFALASLHPVIDQDNVLAACEAGDALVCTRLGDAYERGAGVPRDYARAAALYDRGCQGGDLRGCENNSRLRQRGLDFVDVAKGDQVSAVAYYRKRCEGGDSGSCIPAGFRLLQGVVENDVVLVGQDVVRGIAYYKLGCLRGDKEACNGLGQFYQFGKEMPRLGGVVSSDPVLAAEWYRKACDLGDKDACFRLGFLYQNGSGVARDAAAAVALYQRSCEGGNAYGCGYLGYMYHEGIGVPKDTSKAATLYERGCRVSNELACKGLKILRGK